MMPFNSLGPSDAIWRQRSGSTLAQVMACCLMAPSHYLNQCWLTISKIKWRSSKGKFTRDTSAINHWNYLWNQVPRISFKFPRGQWVKITIEISRNLIDLWVLTHWGLVMHICHQPRPSLVQIMACRLFGAKPLSKPMLGYCELNSLRTNFSEILIKIQNFSLRKIHLKISSVKWRPYCLGLNVLTVEAVTLAALPTSQVAVGLPMKNSATVSGAASMGEDHSTWQGMRITACQGGNYRLHDHW